MGRWRCKVAAMHVDVVAIVRLEVAQRRKALAVGVNPRNLIATIVSRAAATSIPYVSFVVLDAMLVEQAN
jgi:hypothetical protein